MSSLFPRAGTLHSSASFALAPTRPCRSRVLTLNKSRTLTAPGTDRLASSWQPSKQDAALRSRNSACMGSSQRKADRWRLICASEAAGSADWEGDGQDDSRMEAQERQEGDNTGSSEASTSLSPQTKVLKGICMR